MSDLIRRAAEVMKAADADYSALEYASAAGHGAEPGDWGDFMAQALAAAGLLPTEAEWSITDDNDARRVASEEACRTALASILRRGLIEGDRIETRNVTPWKDAS